MNIYLNRYNKIINHYKNNLCEGFVEKHHIIPKCLGGTDDISNLVILPARAHFIAHALLYKAYPGNIKLAHAFAMLSVNNKYQNRKMSSRLYELSKIARSKALKGKPRPEWVKEKLRKPKSNTENYHKTKSDSHKSNISKAHKGRQKTDSHKSNIKKSMEKVYAQRKQKTLELKLKYQELYDQTNLSKKEFAKLHNISYSCMKRYLAK